MIPIVLAITSTISLYMVRLGFREYLEESYSMTLWYVLKWSYELRLFLESPFVFVTTTMMVSDTNGIS
jgi:hypothetical protein